MVLEQTEDIKKAVLNNNVPNEFGIYIISKVSESMKTIIYIGKAGSISNDGSPKKQGIKKRLVNLHGGVNRTEYFLKYMDINQTSLLFEWYVTFNQSVKALPAFVEAELIQKFFDSHGKLPELNKSF